jgi:hypothetical protein
MIYTLMHQHYALTRSSRLPAVLEFIQRHRLPREVHINRVRFWIPAGELYTLFLLEFADECPRVDEDLDLATGHARIQ